MRFKDWLLKEVGTSTADIAGFRRISIPLVRRMWPTEGDDKKKKKPYRVPQVDEIAINPNFEPPGDSWQKDPVRKSARLSPQEPFGGRLRGRPVKTEPTVPPATDEAAIPVRLSYAVYNVFSRYYGGQGDPLYAILSRRGDSVDWVTVHATPEEVDRLASVAEEILQTSDDRGELHTAKSLLDQLEQIL